MLLHLPIILKEKEQYALAPVLSEAVYTIVCEPLSKCVPGAPPWAKLALKIQSVTMEYPIFAPTIFKNIWKKFILMTIDKYSI